MSPWARITLRLVTPGTSPSALGMQTSRVPRVLTPFLSAMLGFMLASGVAAHPAADAGSVTPDPRVAAPIAFRLSPGGAIGAPLAPESGSGLEPEPFHGGASRRDHVFQLLPDDPSGQHRSGEGWRLATGDDLTPVQETPPPETKSRSQGRDPDWAGIGRDTAFFFGYQVVSVAILYALPGDLNRWQNKDVSFDNWWNNVTRPPVWDTDPWGTNYVSHPYWGATYYIRARERGFGKLASFGYSALLSTLYEYGPEAIFERPSAQDLMVTPILGSLVGAFVFEPIRDWVKAKPEFRWYDQALLIATDPFGTLNSVFERMLGIKSEILLRPSPPPPVSRALADSERDRKGPRPQGFSVSVNLVWE